MRPPRGTTSAITSHWRIWSRQYSHTCGKSSEDHADALLKALDQLHKKKMSKTSSPRSRSSCCQALARILTSAVHMKVEIPAKTLEAVATSLRWRPRRGKRIEQPAMYSIVLAVLLERNVHLGQVFQDVSTELLLCVREHAFKNLHGWLFQLVRARSLNSTLWDSGLCVVFQRQLQADIHKLQFAEILHIAFLLQRTSAHRLRLWEGLASAVAKHTSTPDLALTHISGLESDSFFHIFELARRSPFYEKVPLFGPTLMQVAPSILAKLCLHDFVVFLLALKWTLSPAQFLQYVATPCADLLRGRLAELRTREASTHALLYALNSDMCGASKPSWWRDLVVRPWAQELREICSIVLQTHRGGEYERRLQKLALSDIGSWTSRVFEALQIRVPAPSFVRAAVRNVLRRRRRESVAQPGKDGRALGFARWSIHRKTTGELIASNTGQLIRSKTLKAEAEQALYLVSVDVGLLGTRRRQGDVERMTLEMVLQELQLETSSVSEGSDCSVMGSVDLFVDRFSCLSCIGAMLQFRSILPAVEVRVACAAPPWLCRPLPARSFYGKLA